ncbi:hypothetical protein [Treponema endosymbiont of Eucomonympha sp.]|uniref:hypothetical protein n=1 Tax=Treponema endosymbiont of Eucomonympha sp. TaxID=1580831 RepID=UPI00075152D0|nr:hypothetical protein [Treponema endosymbiont of Eucomonympha sp.]
MATDKFPCYSDMTFIADDAYVIEEAPVRLACGDGIRSVEFILHKNTNLLFIEAKTTFAHPENSPQPYENEIDEICEKFVHSLNLLAAVKIGIAADVLPESFADLNKVSPTFVLVVRDHEPKWCRPIKSAIVQSLPTYFKKIWKPAICVINHGTAIKRSLVMGKTQPAPTEHRSPPMPNKRPAALDSRQFIGRIAERL